MQIIPISAPQINWLALTKGCEAFIGVNPTRALDDNNISVGSPESYLSTLTVFKNNINDPNYIEDFTLEHVNISFLMILEKNFYYYLLECLDRNAFIIKNNNFNSPDEIAIIITASLRQWRNYCCVPGYSYKMKEFAYTLYELLRKLGYNKIFDPFKVTENLDGSKQLERR